MNAIDPNLACSSLFETIIFYRKLGPYYSYEVGMRGVSVVLLLTCAG
jgi:hypothetical protein